MSRDATDMQIEQMRRQISELRSKVDQLTGGPYATEKARQTMEQARQSAMEMGHRLSEQKGLAIPLGTLALMGLAIFALTTLFPQTTETLRKKWNEYMGQTHYE